MYWVYIISNIHHTTLYTGFTDDLERRIWEHKNKAYPQSFSAKYNLTKLLYFEEFNIRHDALHREHQLKRYRREWKESLINEKNPGWRDLYADFLVEGE